MKDFRRGTTISISLHCSPWYMRATIKNKWARNVIRSSFCSRLYSIPNSKLKCSNSKSLPLILRGGDLGIYEGFPPRGTTISSSLHCSPWYMRATIKNKWARNVIRSGFTFIWGLRGFGQPGAGLG